jgi:hypothetical protein
MDIRARLEALAAQPKTHRVTSVFSNGFVRTFDAHCEAAANNHADGLRRFIGRKQGNHPTLTSVTIKAI